VYKLHFITGMVSETIAYSAYFRYLTNLVYRALFAIKHALMCNVYCLYSNLLIKLKAANML